MSIISIESIYQNEGTVYVTATIEDIAEVYSQTYYEPAEYGAAICEASFPVDDDEILPDNDYELIEYLEKLDLDWQIVDTSDELDWI